MASNFREYLRYSKKYLSLAEDAIQRGENAEWFLIPSIILAWSAIESFVNNRFSDLTSLPDEMFEMHERAFYWKSAYNLWIVAPILEISF